MRDGRSDGTRDGLVVGVLGARGGAGASVVAASLAHTVARCVATAGLVDLAPEGGGVDVLLGIEDEPGLRWPDLDDARGELDGGGLRERLPRWGDVPVLSATRAGPARVPASAVADVCLALADLGGVLVLDLGRAVLTERLPELGAVLRMCDEVLVVTPLDLPAVAGAVVARDVLARTHCPTALVARGPSPGRLDAAEVGDVVGLEIAAFVPWDSRLANAIERGAGPCEGSRGPVARAGRDLASRYVDPDGRRGRR